MNAKVLTRVASEECLTSFTYIPVTKSENLSITYLGLQLL
jgi:hypothetical protein